MGKLDSRKDIYRGQLFTFIGGVPVAFASTATLEITTEEIDISNKMMGDWAGSLPGKKSYTISSESLMTRKDGEVSFDALLKKQIAGETLEFAMGDAIAEDQDNFGGTFELDESKVKYRGEVMITSLSITSEQGQIAKCSASFKGIGGLAQEDGVPGVAASESALALTGKSNTPSYGTLIVRGGGLNADITLAVEGTDKAMFKVSDATISKGEGDVEKAVTVIYTPTGAGSHTASLKLKSTGAPDVTVALTGSASA